MNRDTPLKLYWSSSLKDGKKNFGDWLSPILCQKIAGREVVHSPPNQCDLVGVGSILQRVKHHFWNRRIHVWGSGFITEQAAVTARHYYHAVRGKKTAALLKGADIASIGDPGLLVDLLLPNHAEIQKSCKIGLVPHYKDQSNPAVQMILGRLHDVQVLDIFSETQEFLKQIASCEVILSSSLHGLIIADSFGIPNGWIKISDAVRGNDFKFQDYYSVFNISPTALLPLEINSDKLKIIVDNYQRNGLSEIQKSLRLSFPFPSNTDTPNRLIKNES